LLLLLLGVIVTPRMGVLGVIATPGLLLLLLLISSRIKNGSGSVSGGGATYLTCHLPRLLSRSLCCGRLRGCLDSVTTISGVFIHILEHLEVLDSACE
jgi:hypothetical protein